jgi:outer membrane protein assembly factor BamB
MRLIIRSFVAAPAFGKGLGVAGLLVVLILPLAAQQRASNDWNQWRGPNRDGSAPAPSDPKAWPEKLTQKWKVEVGSGYATPLVVGNRIYQFSRQGEREVMTALDVDTGKVVWQTGHDAPFTMHSAAATHGPGPKSTPAFANGRLFSIGMTGIVTAYDANTGKELWRRPGTAPAPR